MADLLPAIVHHFDEPFADSSAVATFGVSRFPVREDSGRLVGYLHVKDGPINHENKQQKPAGQGSLPIWDIVAVLPQLEIGVVEFDDYAGDIFGAIGESLTYLSAGSGK